MNTAVSVVVAIAIGIVALLGTGWLGLQVKPKPFPTYPEQTSALNTVELPVDLPAPVARYYKTIIGDQIPSPATVTWLDEGTPWSMWTVEGLTYNVDVSEQIPD